MIEIQPLALREVLLIKAPIFVDERGSFQESYNQEALQKAGIGISFVQDNQSFSAKAGTVRGLHFQVAPFAQDKLVRVLRGAILDVAVDIRQGSPTYGRYVMQKLTGEGREQLLVPAGFAHGFITLVDETEVFYKVSAPYSKACERGIHYRDSDLNIAWPKEFLHPILSEKDLKLPLFRDLADG